MPGKRGHPAAASAAPKALALSSDVACSHMVAVGGCADGGIRGAKLPRPSSGEPAPAVVAIHRQLTVLHSLTAADGCQVGIGAHQGQDADVHASKPTQTAAKQTDAAGTADAVKQAKAEAACRKAAKSLQRWAGNDVLRQVCFPQVERIMRVQEKHLMRAMSLPMDLAMSAAIDLAATQIDRALTVIRADNEKLAKGLLKACSSVTTALTPHWAVDALWPTAFPRIEAIMEESGGDGGAPLAPTMTAPAASAPPTGAAVVPPTPAPPTSAPPASAPPASAPLVNPLAAPRLARAAAPARAPLDSAPPPLAKPRRQAKPHADDEYICTGDLYTDAGHADLSPAQLVAAFKALDKGLQDYVMNCQDRFLHMAAAVRGMQRQVWLEDTARDQARAKAEARERKDRRRDWWYEDHSRE
jgi:hypothetical protein